MELTEEQKKAEEKRLKKNENERKRSNQEADEVKQLKAYFISTSDTFRQLKGETLETLQYAVELTKEHTALKHNYGNLYESYQVAIAATVSMETRIAGLQKQVDEANQRNAHLQDRVEQLQARNAQLEALRNVEDSILGNNDDDPMFASFH